MRLSEQPNILNTDMANIIMVEALLSKDVLHDACIMMELAFNKTFGANFMYFSLLK